MLAAEVLWVHAGTVLDWLAVHDEDLWWKAAALDKAVFIDRGCPEARVATDVRDNLKIHAAMMGCMSQGKRKAPPKRG